MIFNDLKKEVDNWLESYFTNKGSFNKIIYEAMAYSINIGGKRIRPILMILVYRLFKDDYEKILEPACAIEMIHTYSLIHDDLPCMDNDDLRRGKPTSHKVFGEALAVLAGDGLLNEALNILFNYSLNNGRCALAASKVISESSGVEGMIGGQVVDIISENKKIELEQLNYMHTKKTGALIKAAIVSGAILAGAPENEINTLSIYGEKLGLAFQIKDDILDVMGDKQLLGKTIKKDEFSHKTTYVTMYGIDECKEKSTQLTMECIEILRELNRNTDNLEELTKFLLAREY